MLALFGLFSWATMFACLAATQPGLKKFGERASRSLDRMAQEFKRYVSIKNVLVATVLFGALILVKAWSQGWKFEWFSRSALEHFLEFSLAAVLALALPLLARFIWLIVKSLIQRIPTESIRKFAEDWNASSFILPIYVGVFFIFSYLVTDAFAVSVSFRGAFEKYYWTAYWKDLVLLAIIAGLYVGAFKAVVYRVGWFFFRNLRDYLLFVAIVGVISVLAIHAEMMFFNSPKFAESHPEMWQKTVGEIHVHLRDVGLLLVPISVFLFWMFLEIVRHGLRNNSGNT